VTPLQSEPVTLTLSIKKRGEEIMRRNALIVAILLLCTGSVLAQHTQTRTFVSNSGVDSGTTCGLAAPCRTFQYAYNQTAAGGEIVALNSGGYGQLTIGQALNLIAPTGIYAAMQMTGNSQTGITISAGAGDIVRISGITIIGNGAGNNDVGINVGTCLRTELRRLEIKDVGDGIEISQDVRTNINDVVISNTTTGLWVQGSNPAATTLKVNVMNTSILGATVGARFDNGAVFFATGNNDFVNYTTTPVMIGSNVVTCTGPPSSYNQQYFNGSQTGNATNATNLCNSQ
jgi:hypothetical protein